MATGYTVDYSDKRFTDVENNRNTELSENEKFFGGMIDNSDKYYQQQIDASKEWAETQTKLQNEQTDFLIDKIEQDKANTKKDYIKEQSGAYVDWQKQSNQYGANAEYMAASGFTGTGYSESSQVSMYNTYQNRVATAREAYVRAIQNYDNSIKEARLQNNSLLAEIAYNALQQQLQLSLEGFQYKNQLLMEKVNQKNTINSRYDTKWQNVLNQINTENSMAEEIRQFNEQMAEEKRQYNESMQLQKDQFNWQKAQASGSGSGIKKSPGGSSSSSSSGSRIKKNDGRTSGVASIADSKSNKSNNSVPTFTTYKQAAAWLNKKGISDDGGLMTETEWKRRKNSGSQRAESAYGSYSEYLNAYVKWRTAQD